MEADQEKWINQVMNSLDGMERAEPSPFLFAKIRQRLTTDSGTVFVPQRTVWLAVASFASLALLNWGLLNQPADKSATASSVESLVQDMQLYPTSTSLYDAWNGQNY